MSPSISPFPSAVVPETKPFAVLSCPPKPSFVGSTVMFQAVRSWLSVAARGSRLNIPSPGFLVTGPPGCGKAALFRVAAAEHSVPVIELDPFDYLPVFGGANPRRFEDAISDFCGRVGRIEQDRWLGIILLRGIDRVAKAGEIGSLLQANLASLVRRQSLQVLSNGRMVEINPSSQITFVLSTSLPEFAPPRSLGFTQEPASPAAGTNMAAPSEEALKSYGFNPLLLDAFKLRVHLPGLSADDLMSIMRGSEFSERLLHFGQGCLRMRVEFTDCALEAIGERALGMGRNAHSLESVIYEVLGHLARERDRLKPGEGVWVSANRATVTGGPLAAIRACDMPPEPGAANSPEEPGAGNTRSFRRPVRGPGSPPQVRMATAADISRWIPQTPNHGSL